MTSTTYKNTYLEARKIFKIEIVGIILSFVLYSYAIASTTLAISSAKNMNRDIGELQTEIAELELAYFEMVSDISLPEASLLGFSETKNVEYAKIDTRTSVAYNF